MHSKSLGELDKVSSTVLSTVIETPGAATKMALDSVRLTTPTFTEDFIVLESWTR